MLIITDVVHMPGRVGVASGVRTPDTGIEIRIKPSHTLLDLLTRQPFHCLGKLPY